MSEATAERTGVEILKEESRALRGSLAEEFASPTTFISDAGYQLLKFHGSYQQDARDQRIERRRAGEEFAYSFMLRLRLPGGDVHPELYRALDDMADTYGAGTLRLTTRQSIQLHGVLKHDLRTVIRGINDALADTLGACGDVNRNVMAAPAPLARRDYQLVHEAARAISSHLLPRTSAYAELWLDDQEIARVGPEAGVADVEPLYGKTYLPRKFKTAVTVAGDNSVDLFTNDLGVVPILEDDALVGWNIYVGGGLGRTHKKPETFPRLADPLGFVGPDELLTVAEGVVTVQRDNGDRTNRRHARLKYTIADRGIEWFRAEVEAATGLSIAPPRPIEWERGDDLLGWHEQGDGCWFFGLRIMSGRVQDGPAGNYRSALRALTGRLGLHLRVTPNQNVYLRDVEPSQRREVEAILAENGIAPAKTARGLRRLAMACPALPTCGLAIAEAERALPGVLDSLQAVFDDVGLGDSSPTVRMTGCPNGCARPYVAEIGLVGDAVDRYQVWLGGDLSGCGRGPRRHEAGIPFEIVPGVTAGVAGPAFAGIPVTHRSVARSVVFVTAHAAGSDGVAIDWEAIARLDTVVLFMAGSEAVTVADRLRSAGRAGSTGAALIVDASLPTQFVWTGDLATLIATPLDLPYQRPCLLVLGDVVGLAQELAWFEPDAAEVRLPYREPNWKLDPA